MPASPAQKSEPTPTKMQQELSAEKLFADFERDGFRLRAPALPSQLHQYQHSTAVGACLSPVIVSGDELFIDATDTALEHGDLVMIKWSDEIIAAWQRGNKRAAWETKFGSGNDMSRGVKLAWQFPRSTPEDHRSWFWICRDGISKQATAKPLGRVVAIVRGGKYLTGDIVHRTVPIASIDPNAATTVAVTLVSMEIGVPPVGIGTVGTAVIIPFSLATTLVITWTGPRSITVESTYTEPQLEIAIGTTASDALIGAANTVVATSMLPVGVASVGAIASEWYYELPANTQQTVYYNATGGGAPDDSNSFIISNSMMKIEGIKR